MVTFPNCKINLGLNILQKREDGYHDIETVFYPVPITDVLEIISSPKNKTEFTNTGIPTGENENNLCLKAFHLVKKDFPQVPEINMHLHKAIPMGAGLGGGSADAVFTLLLLNKKYNLNISSSQLFEYASKLGSDCPFFIINRPCVAIGRGELLQPIELDLSNYLMVLIHPKIHVHTGRAFAKITPKAISSSLQEIIQQPIEDWRGLLKNDFEKSVFDEHPTIGLLKETLYKEGAIYASMSGSGSSVYGLFKENSENIKFDFPEEYFVFKSKL